jgi:SAM-dependent methyltransferase
VAEFNEVYQRAIYYDIVFNRDVSDEVDFIREVFRHHAGRELRSVLDIACGPGYHARAFAKSGIRAVGLDLRGEMLKFAADQAVSEGVAVEWLEADMRYMKLAEPVDAAISMFDGIDALQTDDDLLTHLLCIADNLTPGGIYMLDLSLPADYHYELYPHVAYHGVRDGVEVDIYWATNRPQFDYSTGVAHVEIEMHINDHGEKRMLRDTANERLLCAGELRLLAKLSGVLDVVGWYGDIKLSQPLDHTPMTKRMICVMQKRG